MPVSPRWLGMWSARMQTVMLALLFEEGFQGFPREIRFLFCFVFFFIMLTANSHTTGRIRWESSWSAVPFSVKFNGFWVKWSVASAQAERCNQAFNRVIGISSCSHQSHTKKSQWVFIIWQNRPPFFWSFKPIQHHHYLQFRRRALNGILQRLIVHQDFVLPSQPNPREQSFDFTSYADILMLKTLLL